MGFSRWPHALGHVYFRQPRSPRFSILCQYSQGHIFRRRHAISGARRLFLVIMPSLAKMLIAKAGRQARKDARLPPGRAPSSPLAPQRALKPSIFQASRQVKTPTDERSMPIIKYRLYRAGHLIRRCRRQRARWSASHTAMMRAISLLPAASLQAMQSHSYATRLTFSLRAAGLFRNRRH